LQCDIVYYPSFYNSIYEHPPEIMF
jgi:hypothetical protein